jgi:hypothetical protein
METVMEPGVSERVIQDGLAIANQERVPPPELVTLMVCGAGGAPPIVYAN